MAHHLVWLRNDLRSEDHPALYGACQAAATSGDNVTAVYIATPKQWQRHDEAPAKLALRSQLLTSLRSKLAELGIAFELLECPRYSDIPALLTGFVHHQGISALWYNREYPLDEVNRDEAVCAALSGQSVDVHPCDGDMLFAEPTLNGQGQPYKVFTPWYRDWVRKNEQLALPALPSPPPVGQPLAANSAPIELPGATQYREDLWPASEQHAQTLLGHFVINQLQSYGDQRDIPSIKGTSTLSVYLASGVLTVRQIFAAVVGACEASGHNWREDDWFRELGWREFYKNLMIHYPKLSRGRAFKSETERLHWQSDEQLNLLWQQGQTGFPIVDAAMRQLQRTGWMHNRLRMITASFYTKLLFMDWRAGEAYFMQHLLDGDFASNNGGWQWSASTGCDASPWFRIFNPTRQSEKFDPDGAFIRKLVPELADVPAKQIHCPPSAVRQACGYPEPIIDYSQARSAALAAFKALSED
mgnify:CR=1 FL=1